MPLATLDHRSIQQQTHICMDSLHPSMIPSGKSGTPWYLSYLKVIMLLLAGSFIYISISGVLNNSQNTQKMMMDRQKNDPEFNINQNFPKPKTRDRSSSIIADFETETADSPLKTTHSESPIIHLTNNFNIDSLVNSEEIITTNEPATQAQGVTNPSHHNHMPGVEYLTAPSINLELQNYKQTDTYNGKLPNYGAIPEADPACPLDQPLPDLSKIDPEIKLRNSHFLVNVSPFGPNNQFRGFRDTVLLAIYLNRTIVLPPWFKHGTDPSYDKFFEHRNLQNSSERLDVETLANFVSVITFEDFSEKCRDGFGAIFFARDPCPGGTYKQLKMYEKISKINILHGLSNLDFKRSSRKLADRVIMPKDARFAGHMERDPTGADQLFLHMNAHVSKKGVMELDLVLKEALFLFHVFSQVFGTERLFFSRYTTLMDLKKLKTRLARCGSCHTETCTRKIKNNIKNTCFLKNNQSNFPIFVLGPPCYERHKPSEQPNPRTTNNHENDRQHKTTKIRSSHCNRISQNLHAF